MCAPLRGGTVRPGHPPVPGRNRYLPIRQFGPYDPTDELVGQHAAVLVVDAVAPEGERSVPSAS